MADTHPSAASVLDRQISISGTITSEGSVRIEGNVDGDIEARAVTLAEGATVNGGVVADIAVIEGRLVGPLRAREARLKESAHVEGEIVHSLLVVEAGAHFEGQCRRDGAQAAARGAPPVTAPAAIPAGPASVKTA